MLFRSHQEEAAQGNDVQGLSMDGAGYNGPVLRELTDPEGLNLDVTVPPPSFWEIRLAWPRFQSRSEHVMISASRTLQEI